MQTKLFLAFALAATLVAHAQDPVDPYKKNNLPAGGDAAVGGAGAGLGAEAESGPARVLSIQEETFSLPIEDAYTLLHNAHSDADIYAQVAALMKAGKARIERLIILRTKSGQRAVVESIDELRYAIEYDFPTSAPTPEKPTPETEEQPADANKKDAAGKEHGAVPRVIDAIRPMATSFETRNVGDTLELEPVLGPDGVTIDMQIVPQLVRFAGYRQTTNESSQRQPLFETQKATTGVSVRAGEPFLLGTFSPPFGTNLSIEKKEHRVWLDFVTVDIIPKPWTEGKPKAADRARAITIPKVVLRDATVGEAVDFLRAKGREFDSVWGVGVNVVVKIPPSLVTPKITVNWGDIPLLDAVKSIARHAGLDFTAEENALVIHPVVERF